MTDQAERAQRFAALHLPGKPAILFNAWDPGSAVAVARAGASAIATGSWSVAAANGYEDGEQIPLDLAISNLERIVRAVDLPVSLDLEAGYGPAPGDVRHSVGRAFSAGAIGCNLEDGVTGSPGELYPIGEAARRVRAARTAAEEARIPGFINARTDLFLVAPTADHGDGLVRRALERARAFADSGASGLFVPGLVDEGLIEKVCRGAGLPVNVMMRPGGPTPKRLADLGVARVSYGPGPYRLAMQAVETAARAALAG